MEPAEPECLARATCLHDGSGEHRALRLLPAVPAGADPGWQEVNAAARAILQAHAPPAADAPEAEAAEATEAAAEAAAAAGSSQQRTTSGRQPLACAACGSTVPKARTFKVCTGCRAARYCDQQCQKQHWRAHKRECRQAAAQGAAAAEGAGGA